MCRQKTDDDGECRIFITEKPFDDNWFSHEESKFSVITTDDWEELFSPPSLSAYIIYQVAQAAINFAADLSESMELRMVHDRAEGCMFDLCGYKEDIKFGMAAGTICPKCRSTLLQYGVEDKAIDAIERILRFVRHEAIGKPIIVDENKAFVVMRFTTNDDNANAYKYGVKAALEELNIKCIRADEVASSGQLLDKIMVSIERSRFVIVKVDQENLNVYYELGFAMGLNKDVLLISEEGFVPQLPSDLRNWECLTYEKGNYEELSEKVKKFYKDNYRFE